MPPQVYKYVIPLIVSALVTLALAIYAWFKREVKSATILSILLFVVTGWTIIGAFKWASQDLQTEILLTKWGYIGGTTTPVLLFLFILTYLNKDSFLTFSRVALLFAIPFTAIALVWTNESHHLIWASTRLEFNPENVASLVVTHGLCYWYQIIYAYSLTAVGLGLLIGTYFKSSALYKKQIRTLVLAALLPWGGHIAYLYLNIIDITHFTFASTGIFMTWGLFQHRFFEIVSVAQDVIIEELNDGVLTLNKENIIVDVNPAALKAIGTPLDQVINRSLAEVMPQCLQLVNSLYSAEEISLGKGDDKKYYDVKKSLTYNAEQVQGKVLVMREISIRKELKDKIRQAQNKAIANSTMKTALLTKVSHNLEAPLNTIIDYAKALKTNEVGLLQPKQVKLVEGLNESAEQLLKFITNLMNQAQLETGQLKLNYRFVLTEKILEKARSTAKAIMQTKPLVLEVSSTPDMPKTVVADLYWLNQMISNLISNAVKFTEEGHIKITLYPKNDLFWAIDVQDSGQGIPQEDYAIIFEAFQRGQANLGKQIPGSGLGLSIVKQLATLMGGNVSFESEVRQGSTFTIEVPFRPPKASSRKVEKRYY